MEKENKREIKFENSGIIDDFIETNDYGIIFEEKRPQYRILSLFIKKFKRPKVRNCTTIIIEKDRVKIT